METTFKNLNRIYSIQLSDHEFRKLSEFIQRNFGIKMPEVKKKMLQCRLHKRLRALGYDSFKEYMEYLFSADGQERELIPMINVVSTNKTDFFREPVHFDFMNHQILPEIMTGRRQADPVKIWSAACSSGEEPYSIAMSMEEYQAKSGSFGYQILGTDISTSVLKHAMSAVYALEKTEIISLAMKKKYLLKGKSDFAGKVKIKPEIRKKVTFKRLNLMDPSYEVEENFDIIFCRNVLIYFDRLNQENVINKLCSKLRPGGYFLLGHSESITQMNVPLKHIKPTIFKKI